jgi:hypothetical protein
VKALQTAGKPAKNGPNAELKKGDIRRRNIIVLVQYWRSPFQRVTGKRISSEDWKQISQ